MMLKMESIADNFINILNEFRHEPYVGFYDFQNPAIFIQDPDIIKQLGIKEFDSFVNHESFTTAVSDELFSNSLFMMQDEKWRVMRSTLSPAFTGSKMRMMFGLVRKCAENLAMYCDEQLDKESGRMTVKPKELFSKVLVDIISTSAFGLEIDCLRNSDNEMYKHSKKAFNFDSFTLMLKIVVMSFAPKIAAWLDLSIVPADSSQFFKKVVADTIAHRKNTQTYRPDVIQLLIEAKEGKLKHDSNKNDDDVGFATVHDAESTSKQKIKSDWSDVEIASQCFIFFIAGFDTTATMLNFAAYQLAVDHETQEKLYQEIEKAKDNLDRQSITYEVLMKLPYLDAFVCEVLRKYPPQIQVDRVCNKGTTISDSKGNSFTIPKGMTVNFNVYAVHYNPKYYPNPDKFDPNRFLGENKSKIQPNTFIPFGVGPRACLGKTGQLC